jgi:hypothetical protein
MNVFEQSLIQIGTRGLTLIIPKSWASYYQPQPVVNLPLDKHRHDDVDVVIHPYRTDNAGA